MKEDIKKYRVSWIIILIFLAFNYFSGNIGTDIVMIAIILINIGMVIENSLDVIINDYRTFLNSKIIKGAIKKV